MAIASTCWRSPKAMTGYQDRGFCHLMLELKHEKDYEHE
jgi:hypothetical protein